MSPSKPNSQAEQTLAGELSYEQALAELEAIVASLEANKLPLEESMALFERGQALSRRCLELLDKAELRIKELSGDSLTGVPEEEQ
jgi:exodeoxyribonuclease VII small subunit